MSCDSHMMAWLHTLINHMRVHISIACDNHMTITITPIQFECTSNAPFIHSFAKFETQHPRCDYAQVKCKVLDVDLHA